MSVPARTNPNAVQTLLGMNYDSINAPSLQPYIDLATTVVDRVQTNAANRGIPLSSQELVNCERALAAHFYTKMDPTYTSRSTAGASGSFVLGKEEKEPYKDMAMNCDPSGCLNSILNNLRASGAWLGKTLDQRLTYGQRMGDCAPQ